jgi:hypothetical protein
MIFVFFLSHSSVVWLEALLLDVLPGAAAEQGVS